MPEHEPTLSNDPSVAFEPPNTARFRAVTVAASVFAAASLGLTLILGTPQTTTTVEIHGSLGSGVGSAEGGAGIASGGIAVPQPVDVATPAAPVGVPQVRKIIYAPPKPVAISQYGSTPPPPAATKPGAGATGQPAAGDQGDKNKDHGKNDKDKGKGGQEKQNQSQPGDKHKSASQSGNEKSGKDKGDKGHDGHGGGGLDGH